MIYDQHAILYNTGKFHCYWKKKIFWPFHQCTPYWLSNYLWRGNGPVGIRGGRGLHSYIVLVMWLGCWVLGVAFTAVELQHLLQQVGPNLHRFDAVRSSWLLHCISPQSKINPSMIIPDLASKLFIVCGARIAHSRTVPSLHCFVIFTPRHRLWNGCNEAPNNTSNITKSSSKQYRLVLRWRCPLLLLLLRQTQHVKLMAEHQHLWIHFMVAAAEERCKWQEHHGGHSCMHRDDGRSGQGGLGWLLCGPKSPNTCDGWARIWWFDGGDDISAHRCATALKIGGNDRWGHRWGWLIIGWYWLLGWLLSNWVLEMGYYRHRRGQFEAI